MSKKENIRIWEDHRMSSKEKAFYSIRRMDLLVISISGACIYIVFEILRFINSNDVRTVDTNTVLLKISAICAVLAIIINFASQLTAYKANQYEVDYSKGVIKNLKDDKPEHEGLAELDCKGRYYDKLTAIANTFSTFFMLTGILSLVIYNLFTF